MKHKHRRTGLGVALILLLAILAGPAGVAGATIFGNVRGIVHDPSHRPIQGAQVTLRSATSEWSQTALSDVEGRFEFNAVPVGDYTISVTAEGFKPAAATAITVTSGSAPILHFPLPLSTLEQKVEVSGAPETVTTQSSTPETIVSRQQIARTPGADRTNSLAMITDFVPGAYLTHDQLHIRGGHQVTWAVDGVPVPNTSIASNVGPQFDPKDVDYLEVQRGSYSADYGDRTYGVFNVVPRTGFERNDEAEVVTSFGNFNQTNDQLSFGSHTERFAYYGSVNGNRSELGLQTPTSAVIHDLADGFGGFGTLIFNVDPDDQLRLVTSLRKDFYQIPNTPAQQTTGVRDVERESDDFVNFSWVHTAGPGLLLTVSPFYHFNRANFIGGPDDPQFSVQQNRSSNYEGAQATFSAVVKQHNARAGLYGFGEQDSTLFGVEATDGSGLAVRQDESPRANLEAAFAEDEYQVMSWLRLSGGVRLTHFSGIVSETAANPRVAAAVRIPRLNWVLRGFYGQFYQAPPLSTVSGPLLGFVLNQGFGFVPLHGERDAEHQFGVTIPFKGWTFDADNFRTHARNFFDHNNVGNSDIFFPLTIANARIRGTEATLRSPRLFHRGQIHVAYSHQYAEGFGAVNGGLTNLTPPAGGFFLDHDQRHTLNAGFDVTLPRRAWANSNVYYGSGFTDNGGPAHLPGHTTLDLALGKSFGERFSASVTALNVANRRFLLDNSLTFGGTHFFNPREIFVQVRYRFHY
ncbi:MAG TPA: TonB-dependent receptor [Terriglobia bacterium]|nr:TonB-dependent receptor [Terriglobia bacterium]